MTSAHSLSPFIRTAKCVSRKCRCTYVKFHRQTAPTGPGHHPPRSPSSSLTGSIGSSRFPSGNVDGFVLGPPSSAPITSTPFPGPDHISNTQFTFNPAASVYPSNWSASDSSQLHFSMGSDTDIAAKYRSQGDILRRAGPPILSSSSPMLPNVYLTQQGQPPSSNWYPAWGESGAYPPLDDIKSFDGIARTHSLPSSEPHSFAPDVYGAGLIGSAYRPRRISLDFSDSSSATSHSVPSSATSSSVHLPLPGSELYDGSEEMQRQTHGHSSHALQHHRRSSMPTTLPPTFTAPAALSQPPAQHGHRGEGSFSSAFGLMSIDEPNVLAGLSSDGVPFFEHIGLGVLPNSPNATPMPTRVHHATQGRERGMSLGTLPTPGLSGTKDGESREMREMWKTFLKSPLGGTGSAGDGQMPQSPMGQRRRMRVLSLPSVTPTVEKGHPLMTNGHGGESGAGGPRPAVHGDAEDLKSYEAAVNARSAPLQLNLVPRRKGRPSVSVSPQAEEAIPGVGQEQGQGDQRRISRPSSSSSTSSFVQGFTLPSVHPSMTMHHAHAIKPPPMQGASISLPLPPTMSMTGIHSTSHGHSNSHSLSISHEHAYSPGVGSSSSLPSEPGSRASSVTSDGTGGGSGSDGDVSRPSFKRYASQTLGPPTSKRALVERGGEKGGVNKGRQRGLHVDEGKSGESKCEGSEDGMEGVEGSPGPRPIAALPERAKRV